MLAMHICPHALCTGTSCSCTPHALVCFPWYQMGKNELFELLLTLDKEEAEDTEAAGAVMGFMYGLHEDDNRFRISFKNASTALGFWKVQQASGGTGHLLAL